MEKYLSKRVGEQKALTIPVAKKQKAIPRCRNPDIIAFIYDSGEEMDDSTSDATNWVSSHVIKLKWGSK